MLPFEESNMYTVYWRVINSWNKCWRRTLSGWETEVSPTYLAVLFSPEKIRLWMFNFCIGPYRWSLSAASKTGHLLHVPEFANLVDLPTITPIIKEILGNDK